MKRAILFSLCAVFAFACDFNDQPAPRTATSQEWTLSGYEEDSLFVAVSDSTYIYTLNDDGTFNKKVGTFSLDGTFERSTTDGETLLTFDYKVSNSVIIHSCTPGKEEFFINESGQMEGTYDACNGIKLFFENK